jgi:hypothetical protein
MFRILRSLEFFYHLKLKTEKNVSESQSVPTLKWRDWVGMYPVLSNRKSYSQMLDSLYELILYMHLGSSTVQGIYWKVLKLKEYS